MSQIISDLLRSLRGLDPLKRLFWSELNYERVNQPLSTRDWLAAERDSLATEPLLFAEHDAFKIIYAQMQGDLSRTSERAIITRMLADVPYALFVFSDHAQQHWHFINVKYERDAQRRRVFRRITVIAGNDQVRTAAERLALLDLTTISRDLFGIAPLYIQQRHDQAFDVEVVTREFYREYEAIFRKAEDSIVALSGERRRFFIQRLFNRLMFIVFLERKGWLAFNGRTDYLQALWEDYDKRRDTNHETNFYWNRLYLLFFSGLNNPNNLLRINPSGYLQHLIGEIPYLNGGLFEQEDDDDNREIEIPDAVFEAAIGDLFYRYNFTITESTPLDIEVAVDPEMLGKIFEELVTGRHETGSYYTPKPVVSFMCREALKGYLQSQLVREQAVTITRFVDQYDAIELVDPEATLAALQRVTVCDPACGSGAYLLGMLQELLLLRQALFTTKRIGEQEVYERKQAIIRRNLYGVDKDTLAINIAQLRLWLSLIVDFRQGTPGAIPPTLPNLDYKIEIGDSLLAAEPRQMSLANQLIDEFRAAKDTFFNAQGEQKRAQRAEVDQIEEQLALLSGTPTDGGFSWPIRFAEVFADHGFDIVLANPPYVRQELIEDKPLLKKAFGDFFSGTADLYTYFYARALQILKPGGMLAFISSNKWLRANYGVNLRRKLAAETDVWSITDFGELPVFQTAATFPLIFVAQKDKRGDQVPTRFTQVKTLGDPYPDVRAIIDQSSIELPADAIRSESWTLTSSAVANRLRQMEKSSISLGEYVKGQIYRGVLTGFNTAFVIDGKTRAALILQDPASAKIIKPLAVGDDVRRWQINQRDTWLIVTPIGIDIKRYPAIFAHLQQWQPQLEQRTDQGKYWWELRACDYYPEFDKPKIVFPDIAKESRFAFDMNGTYFSNTVYFISRNDLYLLAILNSQVMWNYCKERFTVLGDSEKGGRLRFFRQFVELLPIVQASPEERKPIEVLVQRCLDAGGLDRTAWEHEIDERVARLYDPQGV